MKATASSSRTTHRRSQRATKQSCFVSRCRVVLLVALFAVAFSLLRDLDVSSVVGFVRWYGTRFTDYYGPKVAFIKKTLRRMEQHLPDLPDDFYEAWDLSTVLIVVVSVFHLIDRLRVALLAKIR